VPHAVMFARPLRELRRARESRSRQFWHAHVERTSPASVSHGLDRAKPSNANKDLQQRNESCFDFLLSDESLTACLFLRAVSRLCIIRQPMIGMVGKQVDLSASLEAL